MLFRILSKTLFIENLKKASFEDSNFWHLWMLRQDIRLIPTVTLLFDGVDILVENTVVIICLLFSQQVDTVFSCNFHKWLLVSFSIILPMNQHYDKKTIYDPTFGSLLIADLRLGLIIFLQFITTTFYYSPWIGCQLPGNLIPSWCIVSRPGGLGLTLVSTASF